MAKDEFDLLTKGKSFDNRRANALVDGEWVDLQLTFDTNRLQYKLRLSWNGARTTKYFDDEEDALDRFEELAEEHGLD